jgi:hypothetical protein
LQSSWEKGTVTWDERQTSCDINHEWWAFSHQTQWQRDLLGLSWPCHH